MKEDAGEWEARHEMPHDTYMDVHGIKISDLAPETQDAIREFNKIYDAALADNWVTDEEEAELITKSQEIVTAVRKQFGHEDEDNNQNSGSGGFIGFMVGALVGAFIGVQVSKSNQS